MVFFCGDLLHDLDCKVPFRMFLLQPRVLLFQQAQTLHVIGGHAIKPLSPRVVRLLADFMHLGNLWATGLRSASRRMPHHLLFGKSTFFICFLVVEGETYLKF